jgi:NADH-quinone oxidoreductase subunit M
MGLPGLCGFVAEIFVVLAAFHAFPWLAVAAAFAVVLTAAYILWTIQRVWLGSNAEWAGLPDMNGRERLIAAPLVVLTVALGVAPQLVLHWVGPSVEDAVGRIAAAPTVRAVEEAPKGAAPGAVAARP